MATATSTYAATVARRQLRRRPVVFLPVAGHLLPLQISFRVGLDLSPSRSPSRSTCRGRSRGEGGGGRGTDLGGAGANRHRAAARPPHRPALVIAIPSSLIVMAVTTAVSVILMKASL